MYPLFGRLPAQRQLLVGMRDADLQREAAGSGHCWRALARNVAGEARGAAVLARHLAATPDARRILETRVGMLRLRRDRVPNLVLGRLGGSLSWRPVSAIPSSRD